MRDEKYYQRLTQIRQKYGYADQINPEQQFKNTNGWKNVHSPNTPQHSNPNSYFKNQEGYYLPQNFNKTYEKSIMNSNQNIYNLQNRYSKKDYSQYNDKCTQSYYKNEIPSPQKKNIYGSYNPLAYYGREQIKNQNSYQQPHFGNEIHNQNQKIYQHHQYKENDPYSSPIKKLAADQPLRRSFQAPLEGRRHSITPTKYQNTNDCQQKIPNYSDKNHFKYDRIPEHQYRQAPRTEDPYAKNPKNLSPCKVISSNITQNYPLTHRGDFSDKFSTNISNIDKIQSKIQSILQRNK